MKSMRRFVGVELIDDAIPGESTILKCRRLIEKHKLSSLLFDDIKAYLEEQGTSVSKGTVVDATIIRSPSSTKNQLEQQAEKARQKELPCKNQS